MKTVKYFLVLLAAGIGGGAQASTSGELALRDFGRCVVRGDQASALALMATAPDSAESAMIERRMKRKFDRCLALPDGDHLPSMLVRGSVAGALYGQTFGLSAGRPMVPQGFGTPWLKDGSATPRDEVAIYAFATCVASARAADAHMFVASEPGSAEERAALAAMSPHYAACLPRSSRMTVNRPTLRAAVSEAMYHLARAQ